MITQEGTDEAIQMLSRAIELDPTFTAAMGRLCDCFTLRAYRQWMVNPSHETEQVTRLARRALEIEKEDAAVLASAAFALSHFPEEWDTVHSVLDQAVQLNPNLAQAHYQSGLIHVARGDIELGISNFLNAQRLNPHDTRQATVPFGLAVAYFLSGRNDEATAWGEKALAASNSRTAIHVLRWCAAIFGLAGDLEKSKAIMKKLLEVSPAERISTTIEIHLRTLRKEEHKQRLLSGLRAAGMPE